MTDNEVLKEYVVTVSSHDKLDHLYDRMECSGGCNTIPERKVEVLKRRAKSRNTHYLLTESEAKNLLLDKDVESVSPTPEELGYKIRRNWTQTSSKWYRGSATNFNQII